MLSAPSTANGDSYFETLQKSLLAAPMMTPNITPTVVVKSRKRKAVGGEATTAVAKKAPRAKSGSGVSRSAKPKMTEEEKVRRRRERQELKKQHVAEHGPLPKKPKKTKGPSKAELEQKARDSAAALADRERDEFTRHNVVETLCRNHADMLARLTYTPALESQFREYLQSLVETLSTSAASLSAPVQEPDTDLVPLGVRRTAEILEFQIYVLSLRSRTGHMYRVKLQQVMFNCVKNGALVFAKHGCDIAVLTCLDDAQWAHGTNIERKRVMQERRMQKYQTLILQDEEKDKEFMKDLLPDGKDNDPICRFCKSRNKSTPGVIYTLEMTEQKQTRSADEPMTIIMTCTNPACMKRSRHG